MSRFYVSTPIYYVNDVPHIGHAYTTVAADALRRFHALLGEESRMLTGTDEHGLKVEREANARGMSPKAFVDDVSARFRETWPELEIESDFIRTTNPAHKEFVQELWREIEKRGDVYEGEYEDWYCVGCESFKTEKELLPGNVCPLHNKPVERLKEKTFFFRLSKWEKPLLSFYERNPRFIEPASRRNEVVSFVEGGLKDLSVSRTSFTWGIPVPGHERHVMYVWFDALANYRSFLGPKGGSEARFWPPNGRVVHLVGKDILRFHAVYWPAFLLAAGYTEDELPSQVYAHGFLTVDGQKMSKSLRNVVDPRHVVKVLGPEVLRYHLLRAFVFGPDGDFDHAALLERYNADLGKNLGNLLNRTLGLCVKLTGGKVPERGALSPLEEELARTVEASCAAARAAWDEIAPQRALEATWAIASAANQYVDRAAPWAAAKAGDPARVGTILATLLEALEIVSVMMWPALPTKSAEMRAQLGLPAVAPEIGKDVWPSRLEGKGAGRALGEIAPLFPTFDKDKQAALLAELAPNGGAPAPAASAASPGLVAEVGGAVSTSVAAAVVAEVVRALVPGQGDGAGGAAPAPAPAASAPITYDQLSAVDLRVGLVKTCEKVPKKDKLLRLEVDLGEAAPRTIIAGLALTFSPEQLVGRRVVVVANLAPRDFGKGLVSHGMLLATGPSEALHLATIADDAPPGSRLK